MSKWIGILIFAPLGAIGAFMLGVFTPLILFLTPLVVFGMIRKPGSLKPSRLPRALVILIVFLFFPAFFAALLLPFRALPLILHELPFAWAREIPAHVILGTLAKYLGVPAWFPYGLDWFQGVCGLAFGILGASYDGYWRHRLLQETANLPTAKVRSVALGLAELRGKARCESTDPDRADALLEFSSGREKIEPFYLEDETGRILVDPEGSRIRSRNLFRFGGRFSEIVLTRRVEGVNRWGTAASGRLLDGDSVYVLGYVEKNPLADPQAPHVIRSKPPAFAESDIRHLFFLTDATEIRARDEILRGVWAVVLTGLVWAVLSTAVLALSLRELSVLPGP